MPLNRNTPKERRFCDDDNDDGCLETRSFLDAAVGSAGTNASDEDRLCAIKQTNRIDDQDSTAMTMPAGSAAADKTVFRAPPGTLGEIHSDAVDDDDVDVWSVC